MPIETFTLVPNTGRDYVDLTSWAGDAVFPVTPAADDQIEHDDDITVGADGVVTGADGTYTLRLVKADTGTVYAISYEIGEVEPEEPGVATSTFTLVPNTGRDYVELTSWAGSAVFPVTPVSGDQIEYPTGLTVGADGVVTGADGTYTLRLIKADTGTVYAISYVIGEVEPEEPGVATTTFTLVPPDNHVAVALASGFDISLFQGEGNEWDEGEPAIGWQIVYPTANGTIINNLAELQTDATEPFDIWVVDLDGVWYGTYITPIPIDDTPDNPGSQSVTDVNLSSTITFAEFEITGVDPDTDVPTTISNGEFRVNTGAYGNDPVNLQLGDLVQVRHTSSDDYETAVVTTLDMNGVEVTFTSTTSEPPPPPEESDTVRTSIHISFSLGF